MPSREFFSMQYLRHFINYSSIFVHIPTDGVSYYFAPNIKIYSEQIVQKIDIISPVVNVIKLFGKNLDFPKIKKWKKVCSDVLTWTNI